MKKSCPYQQVYAHETYHAPGKSHRERHTDTHTHTHTRQEKATHLLADPRKCEWQKCQVLSKPKGNPKETQRKPKGNPKETKRKHKGNQKETPRKPQGNPK